MNIDSFWAIWLRDLYTPYAVIFWAVILIRICMGRFSRKEWLLLSIFIIHHALQCIQLSISWATRSYPDRYFGPVAPLLWGWSAYGIYQIWQSERRRYLLRTLFCIGFVGIMGYRYFRLWSHHYRTAIDSMRAAEQVVEIVRADYKGPKKWEKITYTRHGFRTARRPVIIATNGVLPFYLKATGDLPFYRHYATQPDYFFVIEREIKRIPAHHRKNLKEMTRVRGAVHNWVLYRYESPKKKIPPATNQK